MNQNLLVTLINNKNVLFVSPTDPEYIRNKQEIELLRQFGSSVNIVSATEGKAVVSPINLEKIIRTLQLFLPHIKINYDLIFIGGLPQVILPFVYPFIRKKIVIVDFFISIYDTVVNDRKLLKVDSFISLLLKRLDRLVLSKATYVVVDTFSHAKYFRSLLGLNYEKTILLYLKADTQIFFPRKVKKEERWRNKFIVFFFGAMNPLQGFDQILQSAEFLEAEEKIVFIFVGPIRRGNGIEDKILKQKNVYHVANWLSQDEIANYIAMSDLCLAGHFSSGIQKAARVIAGKTFIYLAMNKITVLGDNAANRELYSESNRMVRFVPMGNARALADIVLEEANAKK